MAKQVVSCVKAADPEFERFNKYALVGLVVMGCLPTTVASNVIMTTQAGGDAASATIQVSLLCLIDFKLFDIWRANDSPLACQGHAWKSAGHVSLSCTSSNVSFDTWMVFWNATC